jgi:hypothetical protein
MYVVQSLEIEASPLIATLSIRSQTQADFMQVVSLRAGNVPENDIPKNCSPIDQVAKSSCSVHGVHSIGLQQQLPIAPI